VHLRNLCRLTFLSSLFNWAHFYAYGLSIGTSEATQLVVSVAAIYSHELIVISRLGYFKFLS